MKKFILFCFFAMFFSSCSTNSSKEVVDAIVNEVDKGASKRGIIEITCYMNKGEVYMDVYTTEGGAQKLLLKKDELKIFLNGLKHFQRFVHQKTSKNIEIK